MGVGDVKFFEKACTRLKGIVDRSGILFVASNAPDIRLLCNKAIWLQTGALMAYGELNEVLDAHQGSSATGAGPPRLRRSFRSVVLESFLDLMHNLRASRKGRSPWHLPSAHSSWCQQDWSCWPARSGSP
jgi:hypothetical protein